MKNFINFFDIGDIKRISFRNDITGLRAIAVISVVFYHADIAFFEGGWLGVDIFFVISGFLITNIILSELNKGLFSFKLFYLRRVRRIIPALFSTILLTIPLSYWLLTPKAILEYSNSAFASIFFYANLFFQNFDFYNAESTKLIPLLHTWSLAIEEQFYIIFPLFCFIVFKLRKFFLLFLSFGLLYSLFLNSTTSSLIKFYQIQFRAWELLLGALVMVLSAKIKFKHTEKIGMLFLVFSILYFDDKMITLNSLEPRLVANTGTGLILLSQQDSLFRKFLGNKYFGFLGIISYSMYLLHQPFFAYFRIFQLRYEVKVGSYSIIVLFIVLTLLSYINWKFVETYFQKTNAKNLMIFIVSSLLITLGFIYFTQQNDGFKERYDHVPEKVLFYSLNTNLYSKPNDLIEFNEYCLKSKNKSNLLIVGDSHLNTFTYTLLKEFKDLSCDFNVSFIGKHIGRCLLSKQADIVGIVPECEDEYFNQFIESLENKKYIVIAIGRYDTWLNEEKGSSEIKCIECDYKKTFAQRMKTISENVEIFTIIDPVPTYPIKIAESYLYKRINWGEEISIPYTAWASYINPTKEFLNNINSEKVLRVNSENVFCNIDINKCFASEGFQIYYTDDNHLTIEGSVLLIEYIFSELQNYLDQ